MLHHLDLAHAKEAALREDTRVDRCCGRSAVRLAAKIRRSERHQ